MAQLKDIKSRLYSVKSTQKITTAMMMVSSAKLQKSMKTIQNLYPYEKKLSQLLHIFLSQEKKHSSPLIKQRAVKRVGIVAFSSNSGLAGRFNHNVSSKLESVINSYLPIGEENILVYTVGGKLTKTLKKIGFSCEKDWSEMAGKPSYEFAQTVADELMELFINEKIDRVELIYHHFKSRGSQIVMHESFLPILSDESIDAENSENIAEGSPTRDNHQASNNREADKKESAKTNDVGDGDDVELDYIVEPDSATIMEQLLPKVLRVKLFTAHIDSVTSEHAARMTAMQIANDNADDLISELTLEYNKLRQESITNELMDIMGPTL